MACQCGAVHPNDLDAFLARYAHDDTGGVW